MLNTGLIDIKYTVRGKKIRSHDIVSYCLIEVFTKAGNCIGGVKTMKLVFVASPLSTQH